MASETKNAHFLKRLRYAVSGISNCWRGESSIRIQTFGLGFLFAFCLIERPPLLWCGLFFTLAVMVISLELVNSAVEAILDKIHPERHEDIGYAKDCLAGAVLAASITALLVFILYLIQKYG